MNQYNARNTLIAKLAALLLLIVGIPQTQIQAQGMTGYVIIFPSAGLALGQSLRLTLFNPNGEPLRAQARIHHSGGVLVAMGDGSVRSGSFHSFDFKRSDIPLSGEPGTGRLQLCASLFIPRAEPREKDKFVVSLETVSISDGTSNTIFVGEVLPSRPGGIENDVITGIIGGQTLRVTLFNPGSAGADNRRSQVSLFEIHGYLLEESQELIIPPGEFRSFDFNRAALSSPGEPGTGRLQVRAKIAATDTNSARLSPDDRNITNLISFEVIDNNTGRTVALGGQQCLVFFLGGAQNG